MSSSAGLGAWRRYEESTKLGGVLVVHGFLPRSVRMAGLFGFLSAPTRPPVAVPGPMLRPPPPPPIEVINADSPPLGAPPTGPIPRPRKSSVAGFGPNN
ncbi:hypothetical protein BHE74_00005868 [Ensete ventricosum]|nr:hypothetical protein BHE74_00005868 [Ensete ventricosum]